MADDLLAFLRARLAEDEQAAQATTPVPQAGQWRPARDKHDADTEPLKLIQGRDEWDELDPDAYRYGSPVIAYAADWQDEAEANLKHIARHDPARVLAEVAAKRQVVDRYERALGSRRAHPDDLATAGALLALHGVVQLLVLPFRDHPDFDAAWAVDTPQ